jgi:hypothetical protein
MIARAMELELPLGDGPSGELAWRRVEHLRRIVGEDRAALLRLAAAFRSLGAIYAASESELASVVGPIVAARMRWFLDAPLATGLDLGRGDALSQAA